MKHKYIGFGAVALGALGVAGVLQAQLAGPPPGSPPPGAPPGAPAMAMPMANKDPAKAPAGVYGIDVNHTAVIARIPHGGYAFNVVRFGPEKGTLVWEPANGSAMKLDVTVSTTPYYAPTHYKFTPESIIKSDQFPQARFVSTSVTKTGATTADVQGNLTFLGVTRPALMKVDFLGSGRNIEGQSTLGFEARMDLKMADFDSTIRNIQGALLTINAEFAKD